MDPCPAILSACERPPPRQGLLHALEHPAPRRPGRIQRAALDQRLQRPLVRALRIYPLGEVPQGFERSPPPRAPAMIARAPAGSPTFLTAFSPKRNLPLDDREGRVADEFTSGGSTSIPISAQAATGRTAPGPSCS